MLVPVVVAIFSIIFIFWGSTFSNHISSLISMNNTVQARPSLQSTWHIYQNTFSEGTVTKIFGTGPATFFKEWAHYRSVAINQTPWWNSDFHSGFGFLPTQAVTLGFFGVVSILFLLGSILYEGKRGLFSKNTTFTQGKKNFFIVIYLSLLYLWAMMIFYTPGLIMMMFAFVFLGMTIGLLRGAKINALSSYEIYPKTRSGFILTTLLGIFIVSSLVGVYLVTEKYRAQIHSQEGILAYTQGGDIAKAQEDLLLATKESSVDDYYRNLAEVGVLQMRSLQQQAQNSNAKIDSKKLETIFKNTIAYAQKAYNLDPENYHNVLFLGDLYRFFTALGINGAYEQSNAYYSKVFRYDPHSATAYLDLARLELVKNNTTQAKSYLDNALKNKPNYAEAYIEKARVDIALHDTKSASESLKKASALVASDPSLWFELGVLQYQNNDYTSSEVALSNALALVPTYANAKYYLGLDYEKTGENQKAIQIFQQLQKSNPNNSSINKILANLKAGKNAFAGGVSQTPPTPSHTSTSSSSPARSNALTH